MAWWESDPVTSPGQTQGAWWEADPTDSAPLGAAFASAEPLAAPDAPPERTLGQVFTDPARKFTGTVLGMAGGLMDIASPDPIAPGESRLENLRAGAAGAALQTLDWLTDHQYADVDNALRQYVTQTETDRARMRAAEDAVRLAEGAPTLAQERLESPLNRLADELTGFGEYLSTEAVSEAQQAADRALGEAADDGFLSALGYAARNKIDFASSVGPSTAAYLVPAGVAGRVAGAGGRAAGLSEEAARSLAASAGITAVGATATVQNASEVSAAILNADPAELEQRSELYRELVGSGLTPEQAQAEMATRAFTRTLTSAGLSNAVTLGLAARYRANVLEDWIAGRTPSVGRGVVAGALTGAAKETITETAQEGGEAAAAGIGEVGAGVRELGEMFAEVPGAAGVGAAAGAMSGATAGGVIGASARPEQGAAPPAGTPAPLGEELAAALPDFDVESMMGVPQVADPEATPAVPEVTPQPPAEVPATVEPDRRAGTERREDVAERRRVADMTPEEMRQALLTHELTGIGNRRAYEEAEKLPAQTSIDVDSLKWVNDELGHEAGDELLRTVAAALAEETEQAFHISGDEFVVQATTPEEADAIMQRVSERLSEAVIEVTLPDGETITVPGLGVSYGIGANLSEADTQLQAHKGAREQAGLRAARGEEPPGTTRRSGGRGPVEVEGREVEDQLAAAAEPAEADPQVTLSEELAPDPQTRTPEFRRWFGDSQVVDESGEPLRVYHATVADEDFSQFRMWSDLGAHFGAQEAAETAIRPRGRDSFLPRSRVMPVYLNIERPIELRDQGTWSKESVADQLLEMGLIDAARHEAVVNDAGNMRAYLDQGLDVADAASAANAEVARNLLKSLGYDGVVYRNRFESPGSTSYIALDPEQIKSATGNVGTFDPASADITQLEGVEVEERSRIAEQERFEREMVEDSRREGREEAERRGLTEAVDALFEGAQNAPEVIYVSDLAGLDPDARRRLNLSRGRRLLGAYDPKENVAYIVSSAHDSPAAAAWTVAHEIAGHAGFQGLITRGLRGADARNALVSARRLARQNPAIDRLATAIARQRSALRSERAVRQEHAAEEAIAELAAAVRTGNYDRIAERYGVTIPEAQRATLRGAIERFVQRIKQLLERALGREGAFTDAQVWELVEGAWRHVRDGDTRPRAATDVAASEDAPRTRGHLRSVEGQGETFVEHKRGVLNLLRARGWITDEQHARLKSLDTDGFSRLDAMMRQLIERRITPEGFRESLQDLLFYEERLRRPRGPQRRRETQEDRTFDGVADELGRRLDRDPEGDVLASESVPPERRAGTDRRTQPRGEDRRAERAADDTERMAGSAYVPMYQAGRPAPLTGRPVALGAGQRRRTVEPAREKPIRREHIMDLLQREFGMVVYQGKPFKFRQALGFFRPKNFEVRIKNKNDLEVTAHEVFHWLDRTYPALRKLYHEPRFSKQLKAVSYDAKLIFEGFAEFGRLYMTQEPEAIARTPEFYDAFVDEARKLGILDKLERVQRLMHEWYNQGAEARAKSKIGQQKAPLGERLSAAADGWTDAAIASAVDRFQAAKVIERETTGGIAEDAAFSPYKSIRLLAGARSTINAFLNYGTLGWTQQGDLAFTGKGLKHVFEPVADVMDETLSYFVGRRAAELRQHGKENLFAADEINALLDRGRRSPKRAEIEEAFREYQRYTRRLLNFAEQSGILSPETRALWESMYQNYVPFYRVADKLGGIDQRMTGTASLFKRLKGGTANVRDVWENITLNTSLIVHASLKNVAKRQLFAAIEKSPVGQRYAVRIPTDTAVRQVAMEQVERVLKQLADEAEAKASRGLVDAVEAAQIAQLARALATRDPDLGSMPITDVQDQATFYFSGQPPSIPDKDSVLVKGKRVWYQIGDPLLWEMLTELNYHKPFGLTEQILGMAKRTLTRGVTVTPDFQIANIIRDTFNAFTMSRGNQLPVIDALRALPDIWRESEDYQLYLANGGGFGNVIGDEAKRVRTRIKGTGVTLRGILDTPAAIADVWDKWGQSFELATRLAEAKKIRKKGQSWREAAYQGREVSSDFALHGNAALARWAMVSIGFFNARLQGLYRMERELFERQGRQSWRGERMLAYSMRALTGLTMPSILIYLLMNRDDEDYEALPEEVKSLYTVIPAPDGGVYLIPRPFETGALFQEVPIRMLEYMLDGQDDKRLADAFKFMVTETFAFSPFPQLVQPPLDVMRNQRWNGLPVVPRSLQDVEPEEQFQAWTPKTYREVGKRFGVSPLKLQTLVDGYFGTVSSYVVAATDALVTATTDTGEEPTARVSDYPVLRRLMREQPYRTTSYERAFYEMLDDVTIVTNTARKMRREARGDDLEEYLGQTEREILFGLEGVTRRVADRASEINAMMRRIQDDPLMTAEQKRQELDELQAEQNRLFREVTGLLTTDSLKEMIKALEQGAP